MKKRNFLCVVNKAPLLYLIMDPYYVSPVLQQTFFQNGCHIFLYGIIEENDNQKRYLLKENDPSLSPTCRLLKTVTYLVQQTFIIYQFVNSVTLGRAYFFCLNRACTVILKFLRGTQQYPPIYILSHTYLCSTFSDREYAKASQSDVQKVTCLSITQYDVIINFVVTIAFHRQF